MIKRFLNVSLQIKITSLVIGIIIFLTLLLLSVFAYFDTKQIIENKNNLSLQTAKTISFMPIVKDTVQKGTLCNDLQLLTNQYSIQNKADFIVIQDRKGFILARTKDQENIGHYQDFVDGYLAKVFGGYYNLESDEFVGHSIVGKAPILSDVGNVLGVVTVGYLKKKVYTEVYDRLDNVLYFSIVVVFIGLLASFLLARHIQKDTMGLEPREIATLYRDRVSILSSINEGVIATDAFGRITLINTSAKRLLNISDAYVNKPINNILPLINHKHTIEQQQVQLNKELLINKKMIIINMVPITEQGKMVGTVATFRDKTEITEMINTLSEVKQYSDDLRSQTHEFSNKMYVISGLLQLKKYDEVLKMVQAEVTSIKSNSRMIFEQIKDFRVQAILLGKMNKASEKKITFIIDENSSLQDLPQHIRVTHIITIIGNLIDNAFEEVVKQADRLVTFFALDFGNDVIFEISDNGGGLKTDTIDQVFEMDYSTKDMGSELHGFGLFNVQEAVHSLHGGIEINSDRNGTTVTVYIPKSAKEYQND